MSKRVEGPMRLIQVAVPVPQIDPLTYSVPDEFPDPAIGVRVLVPLGKRVLTGIVVSTPTKLLAPGSWLLAKDQRGRSTSEPAEPAASRQQPVARTLNLSWTSSIPFRSCLPKS